MLTNKELDVLIRRVNAKFGSEIRDATNSEKLSIEIFFKTNHSISKESIMRIFVKDENAIQVHPNVLLFLSNYAET